MNVKDLHRFSSNHASEIKSSTECGCFYCLKVCAPSDIIEWVGKGGDTALCPHCGIDALLPNSKVNYNDVILGYMNNFWFRK